MHVDGGGNVKASLSIIYSLFSENHKKYQKFFLKIMKIHETNIGAPQDPMVKTMRNACVSLSAPTPHPPITDYYILNDYYLMIT